MSIDLTAIPPLPPRSAEGFKNTFGTVVVVAGSRTMIGAPCFVARGALRIGCGLVRLAVPDEILIACLTVIPSAIGMTIGAEGVAHQVTHLNTGAVIAAGPGLGLDQHQQILVSDLLSSSHALVLDGDGLTHLAHLGAALARRQAAFVITPHPGEYGRIANRWGLPALSSHATIQEREHAAARLAQMLGAVVVLKGYRTAVAHGQSVWTCATGNDTLAIPGSGDVLTGIISGLMAQGMHPFEAARLGVHVHGLAGDLWAKHRPFGLLAVELADLIPQVAAALAHVPG